MSQRPYLDYYSAEEIVPVHQDISDFEAHVRRRQALYRLLGLTPLAFRGSRVLEIGPGTGDNALVTQTFEPLNYTLLDGNPSSLAAIQQKIDAGLLDSTRCQLLAGDYLALPADSAVRHAFFDIVLAEGCVPFQLDPVQALRTVAKLVARPNGVIVITTTDEVSMLSEICRRYMKPAIMQEVIGDSAKALVRACELYSPHYAHLPAASRPVEDWILDNILHPWSRNWALSMSDAITALPDFQYLGSTPNYRTDWRWYKTFADPTEQWSQGAVDQWSDSIEYTLDWRIEPSAERKGAEPIGGQLATLSREFAHLVDDAWIDDSYANVEAVAAKVEDLRALISDRPWLDETFVALGEFNDSLSTLASGDLTFDYDHFTRWWGRGMQYLSLTIAD